MKEECLDKKNEETDYMSVIIVKNMGHKDNGYGCSFTVMVP